MNLNPIEIFEDLESRALEILPEDLVATYRFGLEPIRGIPKFFLMVKAREALRKLKMLGIDALEDRIAVIGNKTSIDALSLLWEHYLYAEIEKSSFRLPERFRGYVEKMLRDHRLALNLAMESKVKSYRLAIAMLRAAAGLCLAYGERCRGPFIDMLGIDIARNIIARIEGLYI